MKSTVPMLVLFLRRTALSLLFWIMAFSVPAQQADSRVLERGNGPEPDSLDPARAQGLSAHQVLRDMYEGLFIESHAGEIIPGVASSWEVADDGLTWIFHLNAQSRYADGRTVVAADFVFALNRALDPSTAAPYAAVLLPISGAAQRLAGTGQNLAVEALRTDRLRIKLLHPCLDLPSRLSLPIAFPVDSRQPTRQSAAAGFNRNSNGPYRLVDWQPGAWIELQANPYHPAHVALHIQRARFHVTEDAAAEVRRFEAGELHLTETVPPQALAGLRERYGSRLHIGPSLGTFFLGYNLRNPTFKDAEAIREALSLAVDRDLLVRVVTGTGELPAFALLPPAMSTLSMSANTKQMRMDRARMLYRKAGYSESKPLQIDLRFNTSSLNRRLMLAVAAMWQEQLGVQARLRNEDWKVFVRNRRAGLITQVFRGGWNADYADPLNFLEPFESASPLNMTGYTDPIFDQLLDRARTASLPAERQQLLAQAHARLVEANAIIPLFHYTSKHLVSDQIQGFKSNPLDHHPTRYLRWTSNIEAPAPSVQDRSQL